MIEILYEDGEALVINKPAGLPIDTPRRGGPSLADHLDTEALKMGFQRPPTPVHRLDTDTSGCLLLARNPKALKRFNLAFQNRIVTKHYFGILAGVPQQDGGEIALSLAKISSQEKGWRMILAKKGKPAITRWELRDTHNGLSLIAFMPETGRTHQIRVHAASGIGIPLLADPVYGKAIRGRRTMLHASSLIVPREGKTPISAVAPLPADFKTAGFDIEIPAPDAALAPEAVSTPDVPPTQDIAPATDVPPAPNAQTAPEIDTPPGASDG